MMRVGRRALSIGFQEIKNLYLRTETIPEGVQNAGW
jgi:hypothetical protein